jgi:transposase
MSQKKQYSQEFKVEALRLADSSGKSISQIERDLGITAGLLHKWRRRYRVMEEAKGHSALEASDLEAAQAEIRRLRRELEVVRQEREILKAAVAIFSQGLQPGTNSSRPIAGSLGSS